MSMVVVVVVKCEWLLWCGMLKSWGSFVVLVFDDESEVLVLFSFGSVKGASLI